MFLSTKDQSRRAPLKEAVLDSLPPDKGLYLPVELPPFPEAFWDGFREAPFSEIGYRCAKHWLGDEVPEEVLRELVADTLAFDAPLVEVAPGMQVLELFHGPTLAFKDFGARFMARLMCWLTRDEDKMLTVLVATSGDTGGAVASAFHQVKGVEVIILYPSGKVSPLQEKQLTTLGDNITALEIDGSFDDCQALVKEAFHDPALADLYRLTSANSINISRLVPQAFYYLRAIQQLPEGSEPIFVVPSGNFGNLTAGMLAAEAGMPAKRFIAATNANKVVPDYLESGSYQPKPSVPTISNAMDVGAPSNLPRLEAVLGNQFETLKSRVSGAAFTDDETRDCMRRVHRHHGYLLCPHTAVAWLAAEQCQDPATKVILATAHPSKFLETVLETLELSKIDIPQRLASLADQEKVSTKLGKDYQSFQEYLKQRR